MQIYIVRHGAAVDYHDPSVTSDAMRPLTERGHIEIETMAQLLVTLGTRLDLILSSPLVRAHQTAAIFADTLTPDTQPQTSDQLGPGGSPAGVLQDIIQRGKGGNVLLAGHMPGVARLAGYLAFGDPDNDFPFRTGTVCRIDLRNDMSGPGDGDLRWFIPPRITAVLLGG